VAPSDPSGTVREDCLRVRQSGAIRVIVALVRVILDLRTRASSMWLLRAGVWDFFLFCSPGFWDVGGLAGSFARAFLPGRLVYVPRKPSCKQRPK
jgi:hypothetical protein